MAGSRGQQSAGQPVRQSSWANMCVCKRRGAAIAGLSIDACCCPSCLLLPLCSNALKRGSSPELAAALQGASHVKLFLGGEVVQPGLPLQQLLDQATALDKSVVLPSGQGLGMVGAGAPAVPL